VKWDLKNIEKTNLDSIASSCRIGGGKPIIFKRSMSENI
jgi:hypothetical protein